MAPDTEPTDADTDVEDADSTNIDTDGEGCDDAVDRRRYFDFCLKNKALSVLVVMVHQKQEAV